jgi:hypothetical protein
MSGHGVFGWEPVIVSWARPPASDLRDTLTVSPEQYTFRPKPEGYVTGAKPPAFCRWVFAVDRRSAGRRLHRRLPRLARRHRRLAGVRSADHVGGSMTPPQSQQSTEYRVLLRNGNWAGPFGTFEVDHFIHGTDVVRVEWRDVTNWQEDCARTPDLLVDDMNAAVAWTLDISEDDMTAIAGTPCASAKTGERS